MNHHPTPCGDASSRPRRWRITMTILLAVLVLVNMALIFFFSSESGEESGNRSAGVTDVILKLTCPNYDSLSPEEQENVTIRTHHFVRKTAHFLEYALLGFLTACLLLWLNCFLAGKIRPWQTWVLPALFGLLYAASDEIHQMFTGRGPRTTDVLIDFFGVVFGVCVAHAAVWIIKRICTANKRKTGKEITHV